MEKMEEQKRMKEEKLEEERMERQKRMKRSWRLGSAGLLVLLCAALLGVMPVWASEEDTIVRYSEIFNTKEELPEAEEHWTDDSGVVWECRDVKLLELPVTSRRRILSGEIIYPGVGKEMEIPTEAMIEVDDRESGQIFETSLPLSSVEYEKERWEEDLEFTVTFHGYGADYYRLGEVQVPHQAETPPFEECRDALLDTLALNKEDCRLEQMEWFGESYTDETGILCRDAKVTGVRRVWDCRARYQGEAALPDLMQYRLQMEYQRSVLDEAENLLTETEEEDRAERLVPDTEQEESENENQNNIFTLVKIGLSISVSILFLLFLVLGLLRLRREAAELDQELDAERRN